MMDMHGEPIEYRGIAFFQFRTEWNDTTRSFAPMTAEQKQICEDLYQQLAEAGVELGITISGAHRASKTSATFPRSCRFSCWSTTRRRL